MDLDLIDSYELLGRHSSVGNNVASFPTKIPLQHQFLSVLYSATLSASVAKSVFIVVDGTDLTLCFNS